MMTMQETFDKIYLGMKSQGQLSVDADCGCYLRHPTTNAKCAVGQLIDDAHYRLHLDDDSSVGDGWHTVSHELKQALSLSGVDTTNDDIANLLYVSQIAHDGAASIHSFIDRMENEIARELNLTVPQ